MEKNEIKSAPDIFNDITLKYIDNRKPHTPRQIVIETAHEFARQCVKYALKEASEKAEVHSEYRQGCSMSSDDCTVDKQSILSIENEVFKKLGI